MQYMLKLANVMKMRIIKRFGTAGSKLGFDTSALGFCGSVVFVSLSTIEGCRFSLNKRLICVSKNVFHSLFIIITSKFNLTLSSFISFTLF